MQDNDRCNATVYRKGELRVAKGARVYRDEEKGQCTRKAVDGPRCTQHAKKTWVPDYAPGGGKYRRLK